MSIWKVFSCSLFTASSVTAAPNFHSGITVSIWDRPKQQKTTVSCDSSHFYYSLPENIIRWSTYNQIIWILPSMLKVWYLKSNSSCCSSRHIIACSMHYGPKSTEKKQRMSWHIQPFDMSIIKHNYINQHNLHLHFIPEASHFTFKVLVTAYLHGFLLYLQTLDLR